MKKTSFLIGFQFRRLSLVLVFVLFIPLVVYAGTFYRCLDKDGNETLLDFPADGQTCTQMGTYEEMTGGQRENKAVVSPNDKVTKIIVRGNQIFVPVTLVYGSEEVNVNLLMDTGATGTTIHSEIADKLYINLYETKKTKGEVVGGGIIEASIVKMDILKIGPHAIRNKNIFFVPYEGHAAKFDGLLGMDVLGKLNYELDLAKKVITWE